MRRSTASKNLGDDYRDAIGLEFIVEMLRDPDSVTWVSFEADEVGSLDDIYVRRPDRTDYIQAKYAVESGTWESKDLIKSGGEKQRSLLQKWMDSWRILASLGGTFTATVRTRRTWASGMSELAAGEHLSYAAISGAATGSDGAAIWQHLLEYAEGEAEIEDFLSALRFEIDDRDVEEFILDLKHEFLSLGASEENWRDLMVSMRPWVRYKEPVPDGRIRLGDVRRAARLWDPASSLLPEEFPIDDTVLVLDQGIRSSVEEALVSNPGGVIIVSGPPGSGKSSFLTWLANRPPEGVSVVKHHCFIGLNDGTSQARLDPEPSAKALLAQVVTLGREYITRPEAGTPEYLGQSLAEFASAEHASSRRLLVIVDGLDHVVRERDLQNARRLLQYLPSQVVNGLYIVIGTQPVQDVVPESLHRAQVAEVAMSGFSRPAVADYLEGHGERHVSDDVISAALEKSAGNPLYLRYMVETIAGWAQPISVATIRRVPDFGGGIAAYYAALWMRPHTGRVEDRRAAEGARQVLVLLGRASFPIPRADLGYFGHTLGVPAAELAAGLTDVRHLLDTNQLEKGMLRLYHESLRRFVLERDEAAPYREPALDALRGWVRDRADAATRWGAAWALDMEAGDTGSILTGVTLDWLVDSLNAHRPHRRLLDLIRMARVAATQRGSVDRLLWFGWLGQYASLATDVERYEAVGQHLAARIRAGLPPHDIEAAVFSGNRVGMESTSELAKALEAVGAPSFTRRLFEEFRASNESEPGFGRAWFQLSAYSKQPARSVMNVYQRGRANAQGGDGISRETPETWRHWFHLFLDGLVDMEAGTELQDVAAATGLDDTDRSAASDGFLRLAIRRHDGELARTVLMGGAEPSAYGRCVALALNLGLDAENAERFSVRTPHPREVRYGNDAGWAQSHRQIVMSALWRAGAGKGVEVADEAKRLATLGIHGAFLAQLTTLGLLSADAIAGSERFSLQKLLGLLGNLAEPLYPSEDDYYAWRVGLDQFLELAGRCMELVDASGHEAELAVEDINAMFESVIPYGSVFDWLVEDGAQFVKPDAVEPVLERIEAWARSQVMPFADRARILAQTANISAQFGKSDRAERLLYASARNLVGYGFHKDLTLYEAFHTVEAAHHGGLQDAERELLRLAPLTASMHAVTDGDETNDLDVELHGSLSRVGSAAATQLINYYMQTEDAYRLERAIADGLDASEVTEASSVGIAYTMTRLHDRVKAFCVRRLRHLEREDPGRLEQARTEFEHWLSVDCQPAVRTSSDGRHPRGVAVGEAPEELLDLEGPGDLVRALGNEIPTATRVGFHIHVARILDAWRGSRVRIPRDQATWLANYYLQKPPGLSTGHEVFDALQHVLWEAGERELAFEATVAAQAEAHGWMSFFTNAEENFARFELVRNRFPNRALEFIIRTVSKGVPTLSVERVVEALARLGHTEEAYRLTRSFTDFVVGLSADLQLPRPKWEALPSSSQRQILLARLAHPELTVRVRTAMALVELALDDESILDELATWMHQCTLDPPLHAGLLTLLVVGKRLPRRVETVARRVRARFVGASLTSVWLFDALCDEVAAFGTQIGEEVALRAASERAPEPQAPPSWFGDALDQWPELRSRLEIVVKVGFDDILELTWSLASSLGLTEGTVEQSRELLRFHADPRGRFLVPTYSRSRDILETSFRLAATILHARGRDTGTRIPDNLLFDFPMDLSMALLKVLPKPDCLPQPVTSRGRVTTWVGEAEAGLQGMLVQPHEAEWVPVGIDASQIEDDGEIGWGAEVIGFVYRTRGPLPAAEELWQKLDSQMLWLPEPSIERLWNVRVHPRAGSFRIDGLDVIPLVGRLSAISGDWIFPTGIVSKYLPLFDRGVWGALRRSDDDSTLEYIDDASDAPVVRCEVWQDGAWSRFYRSSVRSSSGSSTWASSCFLREKLEVGWRIGWVRRGVHVVRGSSSVRPTETVQFDLLDVSEVIVPD